jgi:hypothetical protein
VIFVIKRDSGDGDGHITGKFSNLVAEVHTWCTAMHIFSHSSFLVFGSAGAWNS